MREFVLNSIQLDEFELTPKHIEILGERTVVVTKWNWEYALAHKFQREALKLVSDTPSLRILICCNHPEVLTNGRGLQKPRKGESFNLVEFNPALFPALPYPLHQIERGGGLTFHHPGQFIFYPIVKLNPKSLSLSHMIDQIFDFSIDVLKEWGINGLHHQHQLLGLWHENQKVASMGIAIEKLTTFHGMAINLIDNENMRKAMAFLNPCGLNAETYTAVNKLGELTNQENLVQNFKEQFLQRIEREWK